MRLGWHRSSTLQSVIWAQPDIDTDDDVIMLNGDRLGPGNLHQRQDIVGRISAISLHGRRRQLKDGTILYSGRDSAAARLLATTDRPHHQRSPIIIALLRSDERDRACADGSRATDSETLIEGLVRDAPQVAADLGRSLDIDATESAAHELLQGSRSRWSGFWAWLLRQFGQGSTGDRHP